MVFIVIFRSICGFLNTGEGGIIYIGVGDNGRVLGLTFTEEQMDHLTKSINHTLSRYLPQVEKKQWDVRMST